MSEAFCLAQRTLAPSHPLHVLLAPHFEGTLFINEGGGGSCCQRGLHRRDVRRADPGTPRATAGGNRLGFDFYRGMLPESLKARNVDDRWRYRTTPIATTAAGMGMPSCQWAADHAAVYYASDGDVTADVELAAWVGEVIGSGRWPGSARSPVSQLVEVLTMVIFLPPQQRRSIFPAFDDDLRTSHLCHERGAGTGLARRQERGRLVEDDAADPGGAGEGEHLSPLVGSPRSPGDYRADRVPYARCFRTGG